MRSKRRREPKFHGCSILLGLAALTGFTKAGTTTPAGLSDDTLQQVADNLAEAANTTDSWVIGTQIEALLELHYPELSVFASSAPDLSKQSSDDIPDVVKAVGDIVSTIPSGQMQLVKSDSVGDPCSLLPGIDMLSQLKDGTDAQRKAVQDQLDALLSAPRSPEGPISHRVDQVQLWADYTYMVPPALSYYGVTHKNESMIEMAISQTLLYRDALSTSKGWQHILLGNYQDIGLWATGNAWAAAGALRVYATIKQSADYSEQYSDQLYKLTKVTSDILDAAWDQRSELTGLLIDYFTGLDQNMTLAMFSDTASSALMAATTYRFAQLGLGDDHISEAEVARQAVQGSIDTEGWLANVVDPQTWDELALRSPEAQAFVLLMQAAWSDWKDEAGATVQNEKKRLRRQVRFDRERD